MTGKIYFILILFLLGCQQNECELGEPKFVRSIEMANGENVSYRHELFVPGIEGCGYDSAKCVELVTKYIKNVQIDTPLSSISIYEDSRTLRDEYYMPSFGIYIVICLPNRTKYPCNFHDIHGNYHTYNSDADTVTFLFKNQETFEIFDYWPY